MVINYIPNDPRSVGDLPMRSKDPRPDRPSGRADFDVADRYDEGNHPPGSPEFLYWQCREAALATLETWERLTAPLTEWVRGLTLLSLLPDAGPGRKAY